MSKRNEGKEGGGRGNHGMMEMAIDEWLDALPPFISQYCSCKQVYLNEVFSFFFKCAFIFIF